MNDSGSIGTMAIDGAETTGRRRLRRSRWAAVGAAVAVTLGGGGLVAVNAASSVQSSIVTIDPVRILDTRTDVGLPGPFVSAVSQKLQVTGPKVPAGATGVLLNVTAVAPTAAGFLSIRPGDATGKPTTSSLNFGAGAVVPNAVQVGLPTSGPNVGKIDITYDAYGVAGPTTEVLIDVVGYMTAAGPAVLPGPVAYNSLTTEDVLDVATVSGELIVSPASPQLTVTLNAPSAGKVTVVAHATAKESGQVTSGLEGRLVCQISSNAASTTIDGTEVLGIASPVNIPNQPTLGTNRTFDVAAGPNTFGLICAATGASPNTTIHYRSMSAIFTPNG